MENWRQLTEFPRYSVSDSGRIRNDLTGRILRTNTNNTGVEYVGLMHEGRRYSRSVAKLMSEFFVAPPENDNHDTPMHLDGNRGNNRADNIVYRPRWYVVKYMRQFTHRFHSPITKEICEVNTGATFNNSWEACLKYGLIEKELVLSILNHTVVWPTMQRFEPLDGWD